jgi:opacity protein-like surface antigen
MKILLLVGLASWSLSASLSAQPISVGVKAGIPINDALETAQGNGSVYTVNNHRYLVGGTVQLNLPGRFSIEVDALYRRLGYDNLLPIIVTGGPNPGQLTTHTRANSWEFPVLGKYAFLPGPIRPFVDAGANFRHITGAEQTGGVTTGVAELAHDFTTGFTFGGGVEVKIAKVRITPELRYTHWGSESFRDPVNSLLHTNLNEGDFMLGITF